MTNQKDFKNRGYLRIFASYYNRGSALPHGVP